MANRIANIALSVLSLLLLLGTAAFLLLYWRNIPDSVPGSYDFAGNVDGMADKWTLWMLPAISAVVWVALSLAKTLRLRSLGKTVRIPAPPLLFAALKLVIAAGCCYAAICSALARPLGVWFLPAMLGLTFIPLAVVVFKYWPQAQ